MKLGWLSTTRDWLSRELNLAKWFSEAEKGRSDIKIDEYQTSAGPWAIFVFRQPQKKNLYISDIKNIAALIALGLLT